MRPTSLLNLLIAAAFLSVVMPPEQTKAEPLRQKVLPIAQTADASETASAELIDEVWQIINEDYIDLTFNGNDWASIRQQYINRTYQSPEDVYAAIQEMLSRLGDPFTRFMDPSTFNLMQVSYESATGGH